MDEFILSEEELFDLEAYDFLKSFGLYMKRIRFQQQIENGTGMMWTEPNKIGFETHDREEKKEVYEWILHEGGLVTLISKSKNEKGRNVSKVTVNIFRYGAANWNYGFMAYIEEKEPGKYTYFISLASSPKLFEPQNTMCVESTKLSTEVIMAELEKLDDMYPKILDYFRKGLEEATSFLGIEVPDTPKTMLP